MLSKRKKLMLLKILSLFSVIRGYNILVIVIAQYLASIYIFAPQIPLHKVVFDGQLFALVISSALAIAGGYIINNFYDAEKDLINRPHKTMLDRVVSQQTKLVVYFVLNIVSVIIASYVSFRAVLFFSGYIFGLWLYSHRLKKLPLIGNIVSVSLAITPFFAVFVYYGNFKHVIFVHALFLMLIILIREFVKDLENLKGDLVQNYQTFPVRFGEAASKKVITVLTFLTLIPVYLLINYFEIGAMVYFFYGCTVLLFLSLTGLWLAKTKLHYVILHNIIKLLIVTGVFSILLINVDLLLHRIL
ncbi:geranylgeranylglycerol-phosphate geranylgeranyltransferase [Zhouia sp. PK063]|uniref:geranylgeranylglycerol-phosphate geranylgeranyltransferase n=1 Tax=Zhouia sp. PK063 TaxID=3373602 RepID=UPI0037AE5C0F